MARGKLCEQVEQVIVDALAGGATVTHACCTAGIHRSSYYRWMSLGDREDSREGKLKYVRFRERVLTVKARFQAEALALVEQRSQTDWRATAWLLETLYPEQWGRLDRQKARSRPGRKRVVNLGEYTSIGCGEDGLPFQLGKSTHPQKRKRISAKPPAPEIPHEPVVWQEGRQSFPPENPVEVELQIDQPSTMAEASQLVHASDWAWLAPEVKPIVVPRPSDDLERTESSPPDPTITRALGLLGLLLLSLPWVLGGIVLRSVQSWLVAALAWFRQTRVGLETALDFALRSLDRWIENPPVWSWADLSSSVAIRHRE